MNEREHNTNSPDCWCNPTIENYNHADLEDKMSTFSEPIPCPHSELDRVVASDLCVLCVLDRAEKAEAERDILRARIAELTEQANAAYAPYRERVLEARNEVNRLANLVAMKDGAQRWIAVSERLPEICRRVTNDLKSSMPVAVMDDEGEYSTAHYCETSEFAYWDVDQRIQYWMPLPPTPATAGDTDNREGRNDHSYHG